MTRSADHLRTTGQKPRAVTYRLLDLFSGIGGFSLGLERTGGFKTVAFAETDKHASKVLARHWPHVPNLGDVTKAEFPYVHYICAGFPCQDISTAGAGAGLSGERSGLWREVVRAIRLVRPRGAVLENVAALLGRGMDRVLGDLAEVGYDAEWHCIPASAVGAPHQRDRVWIVAHAQCVGSPRPGQLEPSIDPAPDAYREASGLVDAVREGDLPYVCRRHDGLPSRVDKYRLTALGNAVVPQIPELIGRAILAADEAERKAA